MTFSQFLSIPWREAKYLVFADFLLFCELVKLSIGRAVQQPDELDKSEEALHAQLINSMPC